VICANLVPDHSTTAELRKRHETALAGLFGEVLALCREAGLVPVGVIAVDGTKVHANASRFSSVDYQQLARKILEEADWVDREEDELCGDACGDELPEQHQTPEGRREALREAKRRLAERGRGRSVRGGIRGIVERLAPTGSGGDDRSSSSSAWLAAGGSPSAR